MKKLNRFTRWVCTICLVLGTGLVQTLKAQVSSTTVFSPVADTWVRSTGTDKDLNYGSDTTFMTRHSTSTYIEIAFLRFDLTGYSLPQFAVIDSAKLFLTMVYNQSTGGVVNILPVSDANDGWDENTVTWNTGRPDTVHGALPIASQAVAKLSPQVNSTSGIPYNWDITSQVRTELSDSNKLLSLAVYPDYKTDINIKFLSRESAKASLRPQLVIYTHTQDPNSFDLDAFSDHYNDQINLNWKTTNETNIAYYQVLHSTDGTNFAYLGHVNTQGASTDTVDYVYHHSAPQVNLTHYYKIETVLKDSTRYSSAAISAAYGITGMVSRTVWEFTQVPSIAATSARLMQSLQMADFNPVGLSAKAGEPLVVNVEQVSGTDLPKLIVGTYDRQSVVTYDLVAGLNTITNANGGDLYIKYSADNPVRQNKVRVSFQSGYEQMPLYVLGSTTHQQWLDQLEGDSVSANVTLIANRVFIVVSKDKAVQYKDANQDTLLTYMDEIMRSEDLISGLDNSSPVHAPAYENKLMLLEKASGNPDATSLGRVRIPTGSIRWILDPTYISDGEGGWGIFHEIGHHHQQYPWSWSACTEVTVNIYSMAAKRFFHPGSMGMASSDWDQTMVYLEDTASAKSYNNSANYVKLGLWNQMGMAFGDSFYHAMHKRTREERIVPSGDAAEIRLLMLYASEISGRDLSHFFRKWNLPVAESVYGEIAALGLPQPDTDPSELREDWAVRLTRGGDPDNVDSVILNGSAYGPEGIKRVEFYADGTKIGTATQRPFNFVWKNVPAGSHTLVLKAIGTDDTVVNSASVYVLQRAVSLTYPQDNASFLSGSSIDIQAATAPGTAISKVEFYAGAAKIGEAGVAPYHYNWSAPADGVYDLKAKVLYQAGGSDLSGDVGVDVGGYLPVADAYVRDGGSANTNFGKDTTLVVKKDGSGFNRVSFLKFDPGNFAGASDSLKLVLHINSANSSVSKTQWQLWLCHTSSWDEQGITWNNQPVRDSLLGTINTKSTGTVEWKIDGDVHDLLAGDGTLTLAVVGTTVNGTSDASFYSRDAASIAFRPRLEVFKDQMNLGVVPVRYSPLKATLSGEAVLLSWRTFSELNTSDFVVEHSTDGKTFREAGSEPALGNASSGYNYRFIHATPAIGTNYYRFKEISSAGAMQYSNVAIVNFRGDSPAADWKLFPNPVHAGKNAAIRLSEGLKGKVYIRIISLTGQELIGQTFTASGADTISLHTAGLRPGIYFVQLLGGGDHNGQVIGNAARLVIR